MSDALYRRTDTGIEPIYPRTSADNVSYGEQSVKDKLDELVDITANGGAAATAARLLNPRTIALAGDAVGDGQFDGSADVTISTVVERITNTELEEMLR